MPQDTGGFEDGPQMEDGRLVSRREDIASYFADHVPNAKITVGSRAVYLASPRAVMNEVTVVVVSCQDVCKGFSTVRKVCGDGNCFYRAFSFAFLESVLLKPRGLQRLVTDSSLTTAGSTQASLLE